MHEHDAALILARPPAHLGETIHIVLAPLATIFFWIGMKPYGKAFAAARAWH